MFQNNLLMGAASISAAGGYAVDYSCRFDGSSAAYLQFTPTTSSAGRKTYTLSAWFKRGNIGGISQTIIGCADSGASAFSYALMSSNGVDDSLGSSAHPAAAGYAIYNTNFLLRDPSAWYHMMVAIDSTQSVSTDRAKIYVNGVENTSFTYGVYPPLNVETVFNSSSYDIAVGRLGAFSDTPFDGYIAQPAMVSELALDPTSFGEFDDNGVWRPIDITGLDYSGTNSFLLDFADSSNLGNDVSGNDNDFASTGLAATDQVTDTPTKNYPTFATNNGRYASGVGPANTISNGNLDLLGGEGAYSFCDVNFAPLTSGKWYWTQVSNTIYDYNLNLGFVNEANRSLGIPSQSYHSAVGGWNLSWAGPPTPADQIAFNIGGGSQILGNLSPVPTAGAQLVMAVDIDNLKIWAGWWDDGNDNLYWMASDGSFSSANVDVPATGSSETASLVGTGFTLNTSNYSTRGGVIDFGSVNGGILSNITQPSGFNELNTANLATPTILDGTAHFQTTLYTGNATDRNISQTENSTFTPDFVWIKNRSAADDHMAIDAARGVTKQINPDGSDVEVTDMDGVQAFSDKLWIDASGETIIGNMTSEGGLAQAFDGDNIKGYLTCAAAATTGYAGVDWGSGNTKTITRMITIGSSDYGYSNAGRTITINIEGSTDNFSSSVVDLGGGTGGFTDATGTGSFKMVTPTSTTAYRYHRAKVVVTSESGAVHFAQVQFFEDNTGDTRGFTLGNGPSGYNDNAENFVAWQWLAGGGAGSSNTDGTINTTTTTVNTTAGISIGTYTGTGSAATIGHGLGVAPAMVIAKCRNDGTGSGQGHWYVYHGANTSAPETDYLYLNEAAATVDNATIWNDTAPTSTVFSIGTGIGVNENTNLYIYYAFAEIEGFSSFGLYTGNGLASGTLVFTGFKPAYVMIKKTSGTGGWVIYDSQRSPYNEIDDQLIADTTAAETTGSEELDFLSNGFKIRTADSDVNTSAGTYVYAAFAEYPFGGTDVTPATAF